MHKQEIEKILQRVSKQRMFGDTDKALANLHKLLTAFPDDKRYLALLGSTYMDADEDELAADYCEKALEVSPEYPEALEVLGMLAEKHGELAQAEGYYLRSIASDIHFRNGHLRLVLLYYVQERYAEVVSEAEFMLQNFDTDRDNYSPDEKRELDTKWLFLVYFRLSSALTRLGEYEKAAKFVEEGKLFSNAYIKDPYFFHREDEFLYKLYYKLGNQAKISEYEDRWFHHYKVPESEIIGMQKDVEQGHIEDSNPENYNFDENGYPI